jgi:AcrR family transcriptional regulator
MPKAFSEHERGIIQTRLKEEAQQCLLTQGMRKTTVDELVRRVNIPKGTFYLFYPSKEMLFFDVLMSFHDQVQADLLEHMQAMGTPLTQQNATELIFRLFKKVDGSFLATFMTSGELGLLMRKLPPEIALEHAKTDDFSMERFLSFLPIEADGNRIRIFSAALRALFLTTLHKHEIGEDVFDDALRVMLAGVIGQLFEKRAI